MQNESSGRDDQEIGLLEIDSTDVYPALDAVPDGARSGTHDGAHDGPHSGLHDGAHDGAHDSAHDGTHDGADVQAACDGPVAVAARCGQSFVFASLGLLLALLSAAAFALLAWYEASRSGGAQRYTTPYERACSLFCQGPVLRAVQTAHLFADGKTFVDMPAKMDPNAVLAAFARRFPAYATVGALPPRDELLAFVEEHFEPAGSDAVEWVPPDWRPMPPILEAINDEELRLFGVGLNDLFLTLGKRPSVSVLEHPERSSLMWVPFGSLYPGARFREQVLPNPPPATHLSSTSTPPSSNLRQTLSTSDDSPPPLRRTYLWDSWWIIRGALVVGMHDTAIGMVRNLRFLTSLLHFAPNGGRVYYSIPGRSQPPLLSRMVSAVERSLPDPDAGALIAECYPALVTDHLWWSQSTGVAAHAVLVAFAAGNCTDDAAPPPPPPAARLLSRYTSDARAPRPESYAEDVATAAAAGFEDAASAGAQALFGELAAAAESGVDFSSRFMANGVSLSTSDTSQVVPADLNAFLLVAEFDLARFAQRLADDKAQACADEEPSASPPQYSAAGAGAGASAGAGAGAGAGTIYCRRNAERPVCKLPPPGEALSPLVELAIASSQRSHDELHDWRAETLRASADPERLGFAARGPRARANASACALRDALLADAARFNAMWRERRDAIDAMMWDEAAACWRDLRVTGPQTPGAPATVARVDDRGPQASDYVPLWALGIVGGSDALPPGRAERVAASLLASGLVGPGGIFSSSELGGGRSQQQWERVLHARTPLFRPSAQPPYPCNLPLNPLLSWPNAWAPQQSLIVDGLLASGGPQARRLAGSIAKAWLSSSLANFLRDGYLVSENTL